ncbi:MAG: rhomboid family intramembrane serine protease [Pirellulaceae bacterium]|nr:MAG: rhomboid family intramembrane serine protease [Pirellulaceae bacterium]
MGIYDREYYGDSRGDPLARFSGHSIVTLLIAANATVFVANFLFSGSSDALTRFLMLSPSVLWEPWNWWRLITYGFAHSSLQHILFNMLSLFFLGRAVEIRLGRWEFLRFYLVTIVVCGLVWCVLHLGQDVNVLGASGAVTAISMLFVFFYPQATLLIWGVLPVKAWVVGVFIIVFNVMTPATSRGGIAFDIHLVGAALAAGYYFGRWNFASVGNLWHSWGTRLRAWSRGLHVRRGDGDFSGSSASVRPKRSSGTRTADDEEADRILRKIYEQGESSLTRQERKFMETYSRKVRERNR